MDRGLFFQIFYAAVKGFTGSQHGQDLIQEKFSASGELDPFGESVKQRSPGIFLQFPYRMGDRGLGDV